MRHLDDAIPVLTTDWRIHNHSQAWLRQAHQHQSKAHRQAKRDRVGEGVDVQSFWTSRPGHLLTSSPVELLRRSPTNTMDLATMNHNFDMTAASKNASVSTSAPATAASSLASTSPRESVSVISPMSIDAACNASRAPHAPAIKRRSPIACRRSVRQSFFNKPSRCSPCTWIGR